MTYFTAPSVAMRYAANRPHFHPIVIAHIQNTLRLSTPVQTALDVGCGTGQSTRALQSIANTVIGTDISASMLAIAQAEPPVLYARSTAECLPFGNSVFDLMTVGPALHWFDRTRFLNEARRVLRESASLIVYDNHFSGTMRDHPPFTAWAQAEFFPRYPSPDRDRRPIEAAGAAAHGFQWVEQASYTNDVTFTPHELTEYLMTQSSLIWAIERGPETEDDIRGWLLESLPPLFPTARETFPFRGGIVYLQAGTAESLTAVDS